MVIDAPLPDAARHPVALSLGLAVVAASASPMLLLDGGLTVVSASSSFCEAFGFASCDLEGQRLFDLGAGEWNVPELAQLLAAVAAGGPEIEAYEFDLPLAGNHRRVILTARRLDYDEEDTRVVVAIADVSQAREADAARDLLVQRLQVLLQEVRHRIANSLQIIASVLLQNARKTPSQETRAHLTDAHQRVMSVAAIERQLSDSGEQEVELQAYFTTLCASISASMIEDPQRLTLSATGSKWTVRPQVSVSLGLIVTELVINALKHAFPENRSGALRVSWISDGPNWAITVTDDGVGMRDGDDPDARKGLGVHIVEALAKQLDAAIEISSGDTGTRVAVVHPAIRLVEPTQGPAGDTFPKRPAVS